MLSYPKTFQVKRIRRRTNREQQKIYRKNTHIGTNSMSSSTTHRKPPGEEQAGALLRLLTPGAIVGPPFGRDFQLLGQSEQGLHHPPPCCVIDWHLIQSERHWHHPCCVIDSCARPWLCPTIIQGLTCPGPTRAFWASRGVWDIDLIQPLTATMVTLQNLMELLWMDSSICPINQTTRLNAAAVY